jgi:hypothetical protein
MRVAIFLLSISLAAAQDDKCAIEGTVLNAKTKEPIKKVEVVLRPEGSSSGATAGVLTDGAGKFKFADVAPGRYNIWMSKSGFTEGPRLSGDPSHFLTLAAGQTLKDLTYRAWPTAVIAGRVVDEDGNPMTDVSIMAFRYRYEQGRRQAAMEGGAQTDDQGHYRIHGLRAGRYYLSARYVNSAGTSMGTEGGFNFTDYARDQAYPLVYFPGVAEADQAAPIQLRAGEERRDVDFRLVPTRTVRVRGRATPHPTKPESVAVLLMMRGGTAATAMGIHRMAFVNEDGTFEIRGVFPGSYLSFATAWSGNDRLSTRQPLEVGHTDVNGVEVTLRASVEVKGRVRVEAGASPDLKPDKVYVALTQEDALYFDRPNGENAGTDGSFTLRKLPPGDYRVHVSRIPPGCYLKAVTYAGIDALEKGVSIGETPATLEVVLSPNGGSVDGLVTGDDDSPAIGATVVLIPEAKRPDLYKTAATDQNGHFTLRGVAPGNYQLYSWDNVEPGAYEDPAFLEAYKDQAKKVSVEEKSRLTQDLTLLHAQAE